MILSDVQRKALEKSVVQARSVAEAAAREALAELGAGDGERPVHLSDAQNSQRLELRAKARQLGDSTEGRRVELPLLTRDVAYEQWHRLLFARFLEQNELLRHPEHQDMVLSLADCAELAPTMSEPDGWSVAARVASDILPGVFRPTDPAVRVRYPRERMLELEGVLQQIPDDAFQTEDALGWVYQFWQTAEKKSVNASGRKIGGADLSPVTQLFTENYMVRFLLENSLGAWWAARRPNSPLIAEWGYLRTLDDGSPAAGTFAEWPTTAAEVTVMDPCCGSGHFLVAAFGMLWRMRAEEEGLSDADAQNAVLRDNLFGLELDPRCTQMARFNLVLEAWKQGSFRSLPVPQVACSGIPVRGTQGEWEAQARNEVERSNLVRLHSLFRNADTLGSLIDPHAGAGDDALLSSGLLMDEGEDASSILDDLLSSEAASGDVLGQSVIDVQVAAALLSRRYTLVATNVPFLLERKQSKTLRNFLIAHHLGADEDLATAMIERAIALLSNGGTLACVSPQSWVSLKAYTPMRKRLLGAVSLNAMARLGAGAFREIDGQIVQSLLTIKTATAPSARHLALALDLAFEPSKDQGLASGPISPIRQADQVHNDLSRIVFAQESSPTLRPLASIADSFWGTKTGDDPRFRRKHWETPSLKNFERLQSSSSTSAFFDGCSDVVSSLIRNPEIATTASVNGDTARAKPGLIVKLMQDLPVTLSTGALFDQNVTLVAPHSPSDVGALWLAGRDGEINRAVRQLDANLKVSSRTVLAGSIDLESWRQESSGFRLPEPHSDDPTQWLFRGAIPTSTHPLQVAVARLLGYRWPDQEPDSLDAIADADGIAALVPLPHEADAATRLRGLLAHAYREVWNTDLERSLVTAEGGKMGRLEDWLRDTFFAQHVKIFDNRPFLWHIWDGHKDGGFSAIVNYHRLDHATLNKLTHTVLGAWIEKHTEATNQGIAGADLRLAAAKNLQSRLQLILDGEPPYDVFVRWKELHEQPIGWEPDLDDGVRLNIRPFAEAGVLRSKVNVHWKKDRGTNPDGSERHNDLHLTTAEKRAARASHEATT